MPIDASVFDKIKTFADYQQAEQAFQLRKQLAAQQLMKLQSGGQKPAALQLADEYKRRVDSGDIKGAQLIAQFAKTADKGLIADENGNYQAAPGYGGAVGSIEGAKAGAKEQSKKNVDVIMDPQIAGGEANAKNNSELTYKPKIETAVKTAETNTQKTIQAGNAMSTLDQIEATDENGRSLLDKATGSTFGALGAGAKKLYGGSDESTQANAQLEVLGNTLVSNVPRMEGPQSNADLAFYKAQAGKIADPSVPAQDKKAAISAIRELNQKYLNGNSVPAVPATISDAPAPSKSDIVNELRRRGKI